MSTMHRLKKGKKTIQLILYKFNSPTAVGKNYVITSYIRNKIGIYVQNTWIILCANSFCLNDRFDSIKH